MKEHDKTDKELFSLWDKTTQQNSQQTLNIKEMEQILKKASSELSDSVKTVITMDIIYKSFMVLGFILISFLSINTPQSWITSGGFIVLGIGAILFEKQLLNGIKGFSSYTENMSELIKNEISFYRTNQLSYAIVLSISIAMFYVLGSMIYHGIKYNLIQPIKDTTDAIVLTTLLLIGVFISIAANFPYIRSRVNNLQSLLNEMGDEVTFYKREQEIKKQKDRVRSIYVILGIIGVITFIILVALM